MVNELGAFIRSRREALSPEQVGLSSGGRRRTPGLRRAELATIAGVSVDYLIRLEQGRDTHPSASVVAALADALQLDEEDRINVGRLGAINLVPELCPAQLPAARAVRPAVAAMVASLEPALRHADVDRDLRRAGRSARHPRREAAEPDPVHLR
jgi:transcriptional regulator with XRE-family HTH domain